MIFPNVAEPSFSILAVEDVAAARPPGSMDEASTDLIARVVKSKAQDAEHQDRRAESQRSRDLHILDVEMETARRSPNSSTAWSRVASAGFVANELEGARDAAIKALRLASAKATEADATDLDSTAACAAALVLARLDLWDIAEELLKVLPRTRALRTLRASILADRFKLDDSLAEIDGLREEEAPGVAALRGYIFVLKGDYHRAIASLRTAQRSQPTDVSSALNLALAYWRAGSTGKAVRAATYATKLSPLRRDAVMALIGHLVKAGELDRATKQVLRLKEQGIVEPPEFLVLQADIALARQHPRRAVAYLRQGASIAAKNGNLRFAAELEGNVAMLNLYRGEIDRDEARRVVLTHLRESGGSLPLLVMLADLARTVSDASQVRTLVDGLPPGQGGRFWYALMSRLRYLECEFDDAMKFADRWCALDPTNEWAIVFAAHLRGQLTEEWASVADLTLKAVNARKNPSWELRNSAAYALALSGHGKTGAGLVASELMKYVPLATLGLCHIASGELLQGLREYREAAEMADEVEDATNARELMTLHQAMALRRLGVLDGPMAECTIAAALPPVDLPNDWTNSPEFQLFRLVAERHGWPWPSVVS